MTVFGTDALFDLPLYKEQKKAESGGSAEFASFSFLSVCIIRRK
jgi:hypothetical protein